MLHGAGGNYGANTRRRVVRGSSCIAIRTTVRPIRMPSNQTAQRIASNVRAEIARAGHTQSSLARQLNRSQSSLSRRLSGELPFDVHELTEIADALGVTLGTLIGEEKASA